MHKLNWIRMGLGFLSVGVFSKPTAVLMEKKGMAKVFENKAEMLFKSEMNPCLRRRPGLHYCIPYTLHNSIKFLIFVMM